MRWAFEAYLSARGQINLFVLEDGELVAIAGKWDEHEHDGFRAAAVAVSLDEYAWREWGYVDAEMLSTHRIWRMVASGHRTAAQTLHDYYMRCATHDELCFCTKPQPLRLAA